MPLAAAEALVEQRDLGTDLEQDGARAVLLFAGNPAVSAAARERTAVPATSAVEVWVIVRPVDLSLVDGKGVVAGDVVFLVAEDHLGPLREAVAGLALGADPGPTGFFVLLGGDPEVFPVEGRPGVRRYRVVRRLDAPHVGGYPLAHRLLCRG